jgi:hypothetical protein
LKKSHKALTLWPLFYISEMLYASLAKPASVTRSQCGGGRQIRTTRGGSQEGRSVHSANSSGGRNGGVSLTINVKTTVRTVGNSTQTSIASFASSQVSSGSDIVEVSASLWQRVERCSHDKNPLKK